MSTMKNKLPWIAAIVLGVVSILAVNKFLRLQAAKQEHNLVYMLTAVKELPEEHEITREDIQLKLFPVEAMSQLSITVPGLATEAAREESDRKVLMLVGRKLSRSINKGEQIFWSDLAEQQKSRFPDRIPEHMRAVSIPVGGVNAVSNLVTVGDKVDVVFSGENSTAPEVDLIRAIYMPEKIAEPAETPAPVQKIAGSTVLLSNVTVLAVGSVYTANSDSDNSGYSSVTLLVTPEEGVMLIQAMGSGQLSLMLRTPVDQSIGSPLVVAQDSLQEISKKLNKKRQDEVRK